MSYTENLLNIYLLCEVVACWLNGPLLRAHKRNILSASVPVDMNLP